jgi:hypothetical protein
MTFNKAVGLVLLLVGCARPELSEHDARTVALTEEAWEDQGLPGTGSCSPLEVVRHSSLNSYANACSRGFPAFYKEKAKRTAGCTRSKMSGLLSERSYVIHIAPGYHEDDGLVVHETLHYLTHCTKLGRLPDIFDAAHAHELVWRGGAEGEATALLDVSP